MQDSSDDIPDDIEVFGAGDWLDPIREVIASLPDEVADWVVDGISFIDFSGIGSVAASVSARPSMVKSEPPPIFPARLVIVLGEAEASRMQFVVAHEIAHHWLGHRPANTKAGYETQEREADAQANEWGFAGESVRV